MGIFYVGMEVTRKLKPLKSLRTNAIPNLDLMRISKTPVFHGVID